MPRRKIINRGADYNYRPSKLRSEPALYLDRTPSSETTVIDARTGKDELLEALQERAHDNAI